MGRKRDDEVDAQERSRDETGRFPLDAILRRHGWKIHSRPKNGPAVWVKQDEKLPYQDALKRIPRVEVQKALDDEKRRWSDA